MTVHHVPATPEATRWGAFSAAYPPVLTVRSGDTVVLLVVQDNLVKGASGQAVQCMNAMFGLPETTGLRQVPVLP